MQLDQREAIVGDVLDHVEARDQVKRRARPWELLEAPHADVGNPTCARHLRRVVIELDPGRVTVIDQLLERAARAAAGVQYARLGWQREPVELGPGDYMSYPGDVPHVFEALEPGTLAVMLSEHT